MYMKKGHLAVVLGLFLLTFSHLSAQLYIGPAVQVGMTYSKNKIVKDTSQYYIGNAPGIFAAGGFDLAYQFDKNIRVQVGPQAQYRTFNVTAPEDVTGLTFTNIKENTIVIGIPVTVNYRIPLGSGGNRFFNMVAGHSLDFVFKDSVRNNFPAAAVDSGNGFARQDWTINSGGFPVSTVLLGAGADMVSAKGNLFNVSLVWGISTRQIFTGSVREWKTLHQDYNPLTTVKDPEEFPDHFYEWALRGSNLSLRASYYFQLTGKDKEAKKEKDDDSGKVEKPAKEDKVKEEKVKEEKVKEEKAPKPAKAEKAPKEKKAKGE
jgi:hypothetical protein